MTDQSFRERVEAWCAEKRYTRTAYLSSGLTNLPVDERHGLELLFERIYTDVFHKRGILLYLPHLFSKPGHDDGIAPRDVHILDRLRISQSDFLVVCATYPSFGVGQEFEIAQAMGSRVLIFRETSQEPVSRMLLGSPARHAMDGEPSDVEQPRIIEYTSTTENDFLNDLGAWVDDLVPLLQPRKRVPLFTELLRAELRRELNSPERLRRVADKVGVTPAFLDMLLATEQSLRTMLDSNGLNALDLPIDVTKYVNPGLWFVYQLCAALELKFSVVTGLGETAQAAEGSLKFRRVLREVCAQLNATAAEYFALEGSQVLERAAARENTEEAMRATCRDALTRRRSTMTT